MVEINEVKISRILNPTAIDLGEYVINPFMGCEFSCLYCYVRSNRVVSRKNKPWGEYVDIRINAPQLLEKELLLRKPKQVLLGSTTECFQPMERKYRLAQRILEILNRHKVYYVILSRSPYILDYIQLLKQGFCRKIYFSINNYNQDFKLILEPKSPAFTLRDEAVTVLLKEGIPVVPYFSPILPWVSDISTVFNKFPLAENIEFECLNFRLNNIREIIANISGQDQSLKERYEKMLKDKIYYAQVWQDIEKKIQIFAKVAKKSYNIYIHSFGGYFMNTYE
ncbi:MAG: radical SAM protein [Candidatus Omnitrophota bacterium]